MAEKYYAHTKTGSPPEKWQELEVHLKNVAEKARSFAEVFGAGEWGYLAGLWHDIGKYSENFQQRLLASANDNENSETISGRFQIQDFIRVNTGFTLLFFLEIYLIWFLSIRSEMGHLRTNPSVFATIEFDLGKRHLTQGKYCSP